MLRSNTFDDFNGVNCFNRFNTPRGPGHQRLGGRVRPMFSTMGPARDEIGHDSRRKGEESVKRRGLATPWGNQSERRSWIENAVGSKPKPMSGSS